MLLDLAPRLLPELDPHLSKTAERVLRRRGVEVLTGQSVAKALDGYVELTTGEKTPTQTLIWCVGVRADPLVDGLDLPTNRGRLVVDEYMAVPEGTDIYVCGDCAAVPDLTRPGQVTGMTAQHAQRQGKLVAQNVAASLGKGTPQPYKHRDLGFLVDLGGLAAAANPLNIPLSGPAANALTRGYHLYTMSGNRMRVLTDWTDNAVTRMEVTSLDVISAKYVPLDVDHLHVRYAVVNEGPTLKRFTSAAMGRATPIKKRTSHVEIQVYAADQPKAKPAAPAATTAAKGKTKDKEKEKAAAAGAKAAKAKTTKRKKA